MSSKQKDKSKFLKKIDKLVDGYKDVKTRSLSYMNDYSEASLRDDLIESILAMLLTGREMIQFLSTDEVGNDAIDALVEELSNPKQVELVEEPEDEVEEEGEDGNESEEESEEESEGESEGYEDEDEEFEDDEQDPFLVAMQVMKVHLDKRVLRQMAQSQSSVVSDFALSVKDELSGDASSDVSNGIDSLSKGVDVLSSMWQAIGEDLK